MYIIKNELLNPQVSSKFLSHFIGKCNTSSTDTQLHYRLQVHSVTQTVNVTPLMRNSAVGSSPTSVASAVCAWLSWEREPRAAIPAFLICSEEPRTCRTTAKKDWCAGLLGRIVLLLLCMFLARNFQKI